MKQIIALLLPTLSLIGCVSSNQITRTNPYAQYAEINEQGKEYRATITVQGALRIFEYEGDYVTVGRDSVQWLDPRTQLGRSAAIVNLRRIRFTFRGSGAGDGAAFGAIPGLAVIIVGSVASGSAQGSSSSEFSGGVQTVGAVVMLGGIAIGAGIGALIGHKTDYIFSAP